MSLTRSLMNYVYILPLVLVTVLPIALGCQKSGLHTESPHKSPAKVEMVPHETELATLKLTVDAVGRLGITTQPVKRQAITRRRTFAGEAMVVSGKSIVVSSPVAGIIASAGEDPFPLPGTRVELAQRIMILKPLLSPERDVPTPAEQVQMTGARANLIAALVTAQGEVQRSQSEVDGLRIARDRAQQLFDDRAGSRRAVDDAEAQLNIANSVFEAAKQREHELTSLVKSLEPDSVIEPASPLTLTAPVGGIVRAVSVSSGQTVSAGSALFEIVNLETIWIRVPIYVDLLSTLKPNEVARLVALDGSSLNAEASSEATLFVATPITAPPTADAANSTADAYYEMDNRTLELRPGQRVGVQIALEGSAEALVIASGAVLYDIYGGTWVYVDEQKNGEAGESIFQRHRVTLDWVEGEFAYVSSGPAEGTLVVVDGAAELFGTEFGAGK